MGAAAVSTLAWLFAFHLTVGAPYALCVSYAVAKRTSDGRLGAKGYLTVAMHGVLWPILIWSKP